MKKNQSVEELSERLMTVDEASEHLHVKKGTLQNWLSQRKFGFRRVKISGKTYVDKLQVHAFIKEALKESF